MTKDGRVLLADRTRVAMIEKDASSNDSFKTVHSKDGFKNILKLQLSFRDNYVLVCETGENLLSW